MSEWGNPSSKRMTSMKNRGDTQGTETSQYLQEKKVKNDSVSSGERKRRSPNHRKDGVIGLSAKQT